MSPEQFRKENFLMKILFMGTPEIAAESLKAIIDCGKFEIVGVISQPDRPFGRKLKMMPSAVKILALEHGLNVMTPESVNTPESIEMIKGLNPDIIVVVAYGQIIKPAILEIPKFGCINLHTSLLPKYRGAAPIQRAVLAGDKVSGVTVMYMNEKMDDGDIIFQTEVAIGENDTAAILHDNLSRVGSRLLVETLSKIFDGTKVQKSSQHLYLIDRWNCGFGLCPFTYRAPCLLSPAAHFLAVNKGLWAVVCVSAGCRVPCMQ
jgi:methionyl-tRNA formyltransferase